MKKILVLCVMIGSIICFNSFKVSAPLTNPTPPSGYTGAPTQNRTCRNCHGDFALNSAGGSVIATGLPVGNYIPGQTYNFSITIKNATVQPTWGFAIKAVVAGTSGTALGTFSTTNPNAIVSSNELKHNNSVGFTGTSYTYDNLKWTAPAAGSPAVSFYMTGVAGDWDGSENGDYVYSSSILNIVLPVVLGDFTGKINGNNVEINWNTYTELNTKNFEIERSFDGTNFEMINSINSANSTTPKNYSYIDVYPKNKQVLYYRLKIVDFDGKFSYSKVIVLKPLTKTYVSSIYSNDGFVNVTMYSSLSQDAIISIYSNDGKKLIEQRQKLFNGENKFSIKNTQNTGIYLIKIICGNFIYSKIIN